MKKHIKYVTDKENKRMKEMNKDMKNCKKTIKDWDKEIADYKKTVDLNKEIGASLGIRSIPTIKVFQNSNIIDTRVGMMNEGQINGILTELING